MLPGVSPEQLATNLRLRPIARNYGLPPAAFCVLLICQVRPIAMNSGLTPGALFRTDLPGFTLFYIPALFSRGPNWSLVGSAQQNHASLNRGGRNLNGRISRSARTGGSSPRAA